MAKRIMLATAGAGKTHYITHNLDPFRRNLIVSFTHRNVDNIRRSIIENFQQIPDNTRVMTFDGFMFSELIRPYTPSIAQSFGVNRLVLSGVTLIESPKPQVDGAYNPKYIKQDKIGHYIVGENCSVDRLSKLILKSRRFGRPLVETCITRLNELFDSIYIDEFQDFRCEDFDLIIALATGLCDVTLVGDFYQHSVAANNNSGKPFKRKNGKDISYTEFINNMVKLGFTVDTTSLKKSWRCAPCVCDFIKDKLGIEIESVDTKEGNVIFLDSFNAPKVLNDPEILKLVWNSPEKYSFNPITWSYSKGDTVDSVCVLLTEKFEKIEDPNFKIDNSIGAVSKNRLYVAMTRSSGNVFLLKKSEYDAIGKTKQLTLF